MKKVLVTGANGFVGSHLSEGLLKEGYRVRALVRSTSNLRWLAGRAVELVYGEVTDFDSLLPAVDGVDFVFHLASTTRVREQAACDRVNCGGTRNLLHACGQNNHKLKRFVFFSSLAATGTGRDSKPVDDTTEPRPVSLYGLSKLRGERLVLDLKKTFPVVIIRPPAIYGPRDSDTLEIFRWIKQGIRPLFGGKDGLVSVCYVDDLVRASVAAIEKPVISGSTYCISDGEIYNYNRVYKMAGAMLGVRTIPVPVTADIVSLYTRFNRETPLTRDKARELLSGNWICDISKARQELGYTPSVLLTQGLRRTISWYQEVGWL